MWRLRHPQEQVWNQGNQKHPAAPHTPPTPGRVHRDEIGVELEVIKCDIFSKTKPFVTLVTLKFKYQIFKIGFKLYHLFGTRFKSCIQYDAGFGHIDHRSGCFLEDEFHLHQGHFCHFNDYLRMRYETTSECLLDHPNRASMVFFVAGGEKSGKRCSMLKFGWPPPLSNHKTWSKLPWSPFFAISLTNAIPPTRWKVLQHGDSAPLVWWTHDPWTKIHHHRSEPSIRLPGGGQPPMGWKDASHLLGGSSQDLDTCLLPGKRTNVPWKSMVGRCSSYGTSPFLGDMRVLV